MTLFPNIFYFLIANLSTFLTWRSPLRLRPKDSQGNR